MTIRVTIKNEDQGENRVITAVTTNVDGTDQSGATAKDLRGGESAEMWVHSGQNIVIKEKLNG